MPMDDDKYFLEEQFILRLPLEEARVIRQLLHEKPGKIRKKLKIYYDPSDQHITVYVSKVPLYGTIKRLPTIIESYKTNICNSRSLMFKTADICHIAECGHEYNMTKGGKNDSPHGFSPPLKNVRKKRFRKTMYNAENAVETESLSKELYYLISTDLEAVSSRFELIYEGVPPIDRKQYEKSLFGQLTSDSEVSDTSI